MDGSTEQKPAGEHKKAHVIVVGNEKGGSGKTTTSMHLITALVRLGFKVGSVDIDARQRSITRYIENRMQTMKDQNTRLPMPMHSLVLKSPYNIVREAEEDERERFEELMESLLNTQDFILIDGPGSDTFLSRLAHSYADTVITPINDSFVDLDVLGKVDGNTLKVQKPSIYSEMIWEQKLKRAKRDGGSIDWIVMRNRLSNIDARNKRFMAKALQELSRRIGFRTAAGLSERVIFRELFLQGLTVLDVIDTSSNVRVSLSHVAARQEVRELLKSLKIPQIDAKVAQLRVGEASELEKIAKAEEQAKEKAAAKAAAKAEQEAADAEGEIAPSPKLNAVTHEQKADVAAEEDLQHS